MIITMTSNSFRKSSDAKVPKFLWKIYERLSEDKNTKLLRIHSKQKTNEENDGITDEHARIIEISDTIMTFLNNRK